MGNPRRNDRWQRQGPIFGLKYLMAELLGTANDKRSHIYLSDGGHFENLGLYELVRRRCRFIVVSDGGRDPDYSFGDLGSAIEKCRVDFGVSIDIDLDPLRPTPANSGKSAQHFALGTIRYRAEEQGMLLYLKLSIAGDEPVDVSTYRVTNPAFPHDSTADQWFTEQQFEAYRQLGYTAASSAILAGLNPVQDSHVSLCKALSDYFGTPIPVMARGA